MFRILNVRTGLAICALLTGLSGCHSDSNVAPVTGIVTLDGAPLKRASVMFYPKAGGRPSNGVTNDQGRYQLEYSIEELGAEIGTCTVSISTGNAGDDSGAKPVPELVPARYKNSPIEVKVEAKSNVIDIPLTSN